MRDLAVTTNDKAFGLFVRQGLLCLIIRQWAFFMLGVVVNWIQLMNFEIPRIFPPVMVCRRKLGVRLRFLINPRHCDEQDREGMKIVIVFTGGVRPNRTWRDNNR